jgi:hypothetical protein
MSCLWSCECPVYVVCLRRQVCVSVCLCVCVQSCFDVVSSTRAAWGSIAPYISPRYLARKWPHKNTRISIYIQAVCKARAHVFCHSVLVVFRFYLFVHTCIICAELSRGVHPPLTVFMYQKVSFQSHPNVAFTHWPCRHPNEAVSAPSVIDWNYATQVAVCLHVRAKCNLAYWWLILCSLFSI